MKLATIFATLALANFSALALSAGKTAKFKEFSDDFNNPDVYAANWVYMSPDSPAQIEYVTDETGNGFIKISSEARTAQGILHSIEGLEPNKLYRIEARVKTDSVAEGRGAVLYVKPDGHLEQSWNASEFVYGTNDWQTVYMDFVSDGDGKADVVLALGFPWGTYNGGIARGTVYWDDVKVAETPAGAMKSSKGKHVRVFLDADKVKISDKDMARWVKQLDKVYETYSKLVGGVPYGGRMLNIISTPGIEPGYWALAGNPILVNNHSNIGALPENFKRDGDWSFGVTHEIGHVFNAGSMNKSARWNWNDELFANFRMNYALDKLDGVVSQRDLYKGKDIMNYYKKCYDVTIGDGKPSCVGDALHYTLLRVKEKYGWRIFEKVFRALYDMDDSYISGNAPGYDKFMFFLKTLSDYAGEDVSKTTYTEQELALIKEGFEAQ